jgi:hypothetical protein
MTVTIETVGLIVSIGVPMVGMIVWLSRLGARVDQNDKDHEDIKISLKEVNTKMDSILERTALLQFCPLNNSDCPVVKK